MLRSTGTWLLVLLLAVPTLCGCRTTHTYDGDKLDREDIAVLKVPYYPKGLFITVEKVDGAVVKGKAYAKLGILPGHHVVHGRARGFGQDKAGIEYQLDFIARPGETYDLNLEQGRFSDKLNISVVHAGSGETISQIEVWP